MTLVKEELHQRRTKHFHHIWVMQPEKMGIEQIKQEYNVYARAKVNLKLWNGLPNQVRNVGTLPLFIRNLKA